jgi:hypothetical protein
MEYLFLCFSCFHCLMLCMCCISLRHQRNRLVLLQRFADTRPLYMQYSSKMDSYCRQS